MMRTLHDLSFEGKRVLLRAEFNVPMKDGQIMDDRRIKAALPTIKAILEDKAQQLVIIAHAGRPKGKVVPELSLRPVAKRLGELLETDVGFTDTYEKIPKQQVVLLENLRFQKEEVANDTTFAKTLAKLGDIYVDDAFGNMHRAHASMDAVPHLFKEKAVGFLAEKEVKNLDFSQPEHPYIAVIGAAKISDKIDMLEALLGKVDKLLLGGAIVFNFFKAKGYEIGTSLCEDESVPVAKKLLEKYGDKIILPKDIVISEELEGSEIFTVDADKIPANMKGLDIGDRAVDEFRKLLKDAATVFWNGPLGVFETEPFDHATNQIAEFLAQQKARIVIGGGDTAEAIDKLGLEMYFTHVSTGGGAALQLIAGKELPGLKALE